MKHIKNDRATGKLRLRAETLVHLRPIATHELREVQGGMQPAPASPGTESGWWFCTSQIDI